jgi:hypothetical protein
MRKTINIVVSFPSLMNVAAVAAARREGWQEETHHD